MLPGVAPGEIDHRAIQVRVYDIHDPTVIAHSGNLQATYRDLGGYRLEVPAGTFDTRLIRIDLDGKVGPASVEDSVWVFYAQGIGPVAHVNYKDVSAFLFFNQKDRYGAVLQSSESATQSSPPTKSDPS